MTHVSSIDEISASEKIGLEQAFTGMTEGVKAKNVQKTKISTTQYVRKASFTCDILVCSCQFNLVNQGYLGLACRSPDTKYMTWIVELSPDFDSWHFGTNCGLSRSSSTVHLPRISGTVHHDTPPVKGSIMISVRPTGRPSEVALLTRNDVGKDDFNVTISVRPHHLMNGTCKIGMTLSR